MANLAGFLAMSHGPQLMLEPEQWSVVPHRVEGPLPEIPGLAAETLDQKRAKWDRCHAAIGELRQKLEEIQPDTVVLVGDDQHENLLDDNMPAFAVFIGDEVEASTSLTYFNEPWENNRKRYAVDSKLGRWIVEELMERNFDPAYSRQTKFPGGLGHAFARPLKWIQADGRYKVVPIMVNTYFPPAPSPKRCAHFGRSLVDIIESYGSDERVVLIASGGLSHTKIDETLDHEVLDSVARNDVNSLEQLSPEVLVHGTSEVRNWIVVGAAADKPAKVLAYEPLYRTVNGIGCAMAFAYWP